MDLISFAEYAAMHNVVAATVRQKNLRGGFKTAQKIGRNWVIDRNEPYSDDRQTLLDKSTVDRVTSTYQKNESLKETARIEKLSEQKVRKILITVGSYTTPQIKSVNDLYEKGLTPKEIEVKLGISRAAVNSCLPYDKSIYNRDDPTLNSERIRKTRNKQ